MSEEKQEISEKIKQLVIARIEAQMPSNLKLSMGFGGSLTKEEMIEHVKAGDEQGVHIVNMHINFIKALTTGKLMKEVNSV